MKKFIALILILGFTTPAMSASQWDKANPAGTTSVADLDYYITSVNNEAMDRLAINYRRDCTVIPNSAATISVLSGEISISNSDGSVVRWRRNTSTTSVSWSDIDTGAEASATQYYVWALADSDATTFTVKISASSSSPSGATYYRKIGYFYNNSSGDIVSVGNIKGGDVPNIISVSGTTDITTSSTSYSDMDDMVIYFVSSGRPLRLSFTGPAGNNASEAGNIQFTVDGTAYGATGVYSNTANPSNYPFKMENLITSLSAGTHTIKVQWKADSGRSLYQSGSSDGQRILIAEEK